MYTETVLLLATHTATYRLFLHKWYDLLKASFGTITWWKRKNNETKQRPLSCVVHLTKRVTLSISHYWTVLFVNGAHPLMAADLLQVGLLQLEVLQLVVMTTIMMMLLCFTVCLLYLSM